LENILKKIGSKFLHFKNSITFAIPQKKGRSLSFKDTDKKDNVILFHSTKPE
jgi:hypothetical protein